MLLRHHEDDSGSWPDWEDVKDALRRKNDVKKAILADQGWRTNDQMNFKPKAKTRMGRCDRALAGKAIYRIFTKSGDHDQEYPFEQHIPEGPQLVPPMRGWKLVPSTVSRVYFASYREKFVSLKNPGQDDNLIMNKVLPNFANPFIKYPDEDCSLATKVLRQACHTREGNLEWPTHAERLAKKFAHNKPDKYSWSDWVNYWSSAGN